MVREAIARITSGSSLDESEMRALIGEMMDGDVTDAQKSAVLVALRMRGETVEEITGAALAMRDRVQRVDGVASDAIDTCGTGGDGRGTLNISTLASLIVAACGCSVAKHGNRAVSSACGSADLLAALGVNIDLSAAEAGEVLRRCGIAFLFAPRLHPAMKAMANVRRQLGIRTIFNLLGPLTNPAFVRRQLLGVFAPHLLETVAHVLQNLGSERAMVVHSADGTDEISVCAPTHVCELRDGAIRAYTITPEELQLGRTGGGAAAGGSIDDNRRLALEVLGGARGIHRDTVIANAAAALCVAGASASLREGVAAAARCIDSGMAAAKLEEFARVSNEYPESAA
jgi:anthranilate phosphoribosyltransferase